MPATTCDPGLNQRCVVLEFESLEKAIATYEGPEYRAAKKLLEGTVGRNVRIVEGASEPYRRKCNRRKLSIQYT